jgi:hypothetical protein
MTEYELLSLWAKARLHVILSQVAPIFLLIVTVALLETGLRETPLSVRLATAGILLASGLLGVVAQFSAGNEAMAVADDLRALGAGDAITARVVAERRFADIVRFVGPAIFVVIFLALLWALFVA